MALRQREAQRRERPCAHVVIAVDGEDRGDDLSPGTRSFPVCSIFSTVLPPQLVHGPDDRIDVYVIEGDAVGAAPRAGDARREALAWREIEAVGIRAGGAGVDEARELLSGLGSARRARHRGARRRAAAIRWTSSTVRSSPAPSSSAMSFRLKPRPLPRWMNARRQRSVSPYCRYPDGVRGGSGRMPSRS